MTQSIPGIHHITAMASDPQQNIEFYVNVLGQRLVKTTVNFDDPGTYHFYYGDEVGTPGTILTFFPWPGARRGQRGVGEVAAAAYAVPAGSLPAWQQRLAAWGHTTSAPQLRFGEQVISFQDPDGMVVELIETAVPARVQSWADSPVPHAMASRGFHSATVWVGELEPSLELLTKVFGWQRIAQEGSRVRVQAAGGGLGSYLDLVVFPNQARGRLGAGSVHHIAFRAADDAAQLHGNVIYCPPATGSRRCRTVNTSIPSISANQRACCTRSRPMRLVLPGTNRWANSGKASSSRRGWSPVAIVSHVRCQ